MSGNRRPGCSYENCVVQQLPFHDTRVSLSFNSITNWGSRPGELDGAWVLNFNRTLRVWSARPQGALGENAREDVVMAMSVQQARFNLRLQWPNYDQCRICEGLRRC